MMSVLAPLTVENHKWAAAHLQKAPKISLRGLDLNARFHLQTGQKLDTTGTPYRIRTGVTAVRERKHRVDQIVQGVFWIRLAIECALSP